MQESINNANEQNSPVTHKIEWKVPQNEFETDFLITNALTTISKILIISFFIAFAILLGYILIQNK